MPVYLQTKLLRVLQERTVRRLGDEREISVDFRLDLLNQSRDRSDDSRREHCARILYFRLSTVRIKVPPLRERLDDLLMLSETFLLRLARKYKKPHARYLSGELRNAHALQLAGQCARAGER